MSSGRARTTRGPRLMVLLLGLAVLPMLGVGWFVAEQYRDLGTVDSLVERIEGGVDDVRELDRLRLALTAEGNWVTARKGVDELGVPVALVTNITGIDLDAELAAARDAVDDLIVDAAGSSFRDDVVALRRDDTDELTRLQARYVELEQSVAERSETLRSVVEADASAVPEGGRIVTAVRIADATTTARLEYSKLHWSYFRAEFGVITNSAPDPVSIVRRRDATVTALDLVERISPPSAAIADLARATQDDPAAVEFLASVDELIDDRFGDAPMLDGDDASLMDRIADGTETFIVAIDAFPAFDRLVDRSVLDVQAATDDVVSAAQRELTRTILLLGALAVASMTVAVALARYIGRPMVRLGAAATSLGSGADVDIPRTGPAEVRDVGDALAAAAAGLALVERLEHEATHDDLTGIAGRRLALQRLEQAAARTSRSGSRGALLFIDLDGFKLVNDTYGHPAGDEVLRVIAGRIGSVLRLEDEVGRYGGDELVVVAEPIESDSAALALGERIVDAVEAPIDVSEHSSDAPPDGVRLSASVGVATFGAGESGDDIVRRADEATYAAKSAGGARATLSTGPPTPGPDHESHARHEGAAAEIHESVAT